MSPREHWSSDSAEAVDLLIQACNKPRPSLEAPSQPHLIGRELTPYFGSSEPAQTTNGHNKASAKRKNVSPQHASRPRSAGASASSPPPSASKADGPHTGPRQHAHKQPKASSGSSSSEDEAHPARKQPKASSPVAAKPRHPSPPTSASSSPSCPGQFRASPKPDALPVPSSMLLLAALSRQAPARVAVVA